MYTCIHITWTDGVINEYMNDGWIGEWINGYMDGWIVGWMDEWIDRCFNFLQE